MSLMQLVAYGAQDTWLTGRPDITFFRTSYRLHSNFNLITPYAADEFARQIRRIDWPQFRIPLLPDQLVNFVFKLTNFETCLRHGRFDAAISLFESDKHTRDWGAMHSCKLIKTIYGLLKSEQEKEEKEQTAPPFES